MLARTALAVALIVTCGVYARGAAGPEHPAPRISLSSMPFILGEWHGAEAAPLADDVLSQLGVDDYINRHYAGTGAAPVAVYVGYYASQRQGDTIHSPRTVCQVRGGSRSFRIGRRSVPAVSRFL